MGYNHRIRVETDCSRSLYSQWCSSLHRKQCYNLLSFFGIYSLLVGPRSRNYRFPKIIKTTREKKIKKKKRRRELVNVT